MKVLVTDNMEIEYLKLDKRFTIDYRPGISREELLEMIGDYEVLVVRSRTKVDSGVIDRAKKLRLIARPGTGLDNIDLDYARSRNIVVLNSPESLVESVAEHTILLMLALARSITVADSALKQGRWIKDKLIGMELRGKNLGIIGLGKIGRRVAEIAKAIGMRISAYDVVPIPHEVLGTIGCKIIGLDELLSSSDFVTLHVPLTEGTRHLIDSNALSIMKKGAYIVNTSRGGVIDEEALVKALNEGRIAGAALDVFENEPPDARILSAKNVILTPHIAGQTLEAQREAISLIASKITDFFSKVEY